MIRKWLQFELAKHYPDVKFEVLIPPDPKMGDYSTNIAFALAKREGKNPSEAASGVAEKFAYAEFFERIEVAKPGFVNFYLKADFLRSELKRIHEHRAHCGKSDLGGDKTVIVEYPSINVAKPPHVGHLRSAVIGDALANAHDALGYRVIRWDYVGDWGTQFGKLIAAYKLWGSERELQEKPVQTLLGLYVRFHKELETNPELEQKGRDEFLKLEEGNEENRRLWSWFRELSLSEVKLLYRELGIRTDVTKGESDYEQQMMLVVFELGKKGIAVDSPEGGVIVPLEKYDLPPALIRKTDGASLYITRDVASLKDRIDNFSPEKVLYVVANQQTLHLAQLAAIAKELELPTEVIHVKYGLVLGDDGKKFSTREGNVVTLQEVMDKITALAADVVKQKNPELPAERIKEIAHAVGIGALKYNDLKQNPYSDIVFDWKAMLDLSGNSGPYLQYTYARLANILEKSGQKEFSGDPAMLKEPEELALVRHLLDFSDAIENCAQLYALSGLALYLYELAVRANRFYEAHRVLDDDDAGRKLARLMLVQTVAAVIERGLNLLGIEALKKI